jgi:hypothetical protein
MYNIAGNVEGVNNTIIAYSKAEPIAANQAMVSERP